MGGGAQQTTQQTSVANNTSTVDAQKTNTFDIVQNGLTSAQAQQLFSTIDQQQTLGVAGQALNNTSAAITSAPVDSGLVTIVVLMIVAALIFRRSG